MDTDAVTAGVSTATRQTQLRKVMPYPATKYDSNIRKPPVAMPQTTVKQLQDRANAEIAAQGGFPNTPDARVDPNLLQNEQGVLVARQKAATDVNFDARGHREKHREHDGAQRKDTLRTRRARCHCGGDGHGPLSGVSSRRAPAAG